MARGQIISKWAAKHWKEIVIMIAGASAFLFSNKIGNTTIQNPWLLFVLLALGLYGGDTLWNSWRHKTRQYVDLAGHESVKAPGVYPVGEWGVIVTGSVDAEGISWEGGKGTRVVPLNSIEIWPTFVVSWSKPIKVDRSKLPSEVQSFIEGKDAFKEPFMLSTVTSRPIHISEVYKAMIDKVDEFKANPTPDIQSKLAELQKVIDEKLKVMETTYSKETSRHNTRFTEMQGIITGQQELLDDKYQGIGRFLDIVGSAKRAVGKEPFLTKLLKGEKEGG